jgi:hypothetical protein
MRRRQRELLRESVRQLAADQGGVVSRRQLFGLGLTHWQIAAELRAGRWAQHLRQTIAVHTGELGELGLWWSAIFEVGSGAALDGASALCAAGLKGFDAPIHVSAPKSSRPRRPRSVIVHETRRRHPDDLVHGGLTRVRSAVAAIRAALWARSDKQAALMLAMCVQQRIVAVPELTEAFASIRRHRRRSLIKTVLADLSNGVHSIGELEFARLCREFGLPEPDRQARRVGPNGVMYLDSEWSAYEVIVEIEGVHHLDPSQALADTSRQNELTIGNGRVLRIPVIGLRVDAHLYLSQLTRLLRSAGWQG